MPTTNQLYPLQQLQASDQLPVWSTNNGDTRSATLAVLVAFLSDNFEYFIASSYIQTMPVTVSNLPSASEAGSGARAFVSDANNSAFNAVVVGGGASSLPVSSDGAAWRIG